MKVTVCELSNDIHRLEHSIDEMHRCFKKIRNCVPNHGTLGYNISQMKCIIVFPNYETVRYNIH